MAGWLAAWLAGQLSDHSDPRVLISRMVEAKMMIQGRRKHTIQMIPVHNFPNLKKTTKVNNNNFPILQATNLQSTITERHITCNSTRTEQVTSCSQRSKNTMLRSLVRAVPSSAQWHCRCVSFERAGVEQPFRAPSGCARRPRSHSECSSGLAWRAFLYAEVWSSDQRV